MGIYYEKQCYSDTGVTAVAEAGGYPELGPAMELAQAALDRSDEAVIGQHCHVTYVPASHWSPAQPPPVRRAGCGLLHLPGGAGHHGPGQGEGRRIGHRLRDTE